MNPVILQKVHLWLSQSFLLQNNFFLSQFFSDVYGALQMEKKFKKLKVLARNPLAVRVTRGQKLCTNIKAIYIVLQAYARIF